MNENETNTFARDLRPGQVFHTSNPSGTLYTVESVRAGQARTIVIYRTSDGTRMEMNIPSLSSCWVVS